MFDQNTLLTDSGQVRDTLFRIPKEWLEQSEVFIKEFLETKERESESSDTEIVQVDSERLDRVVLRDVSAADFRAFLKILIPQ